jgi:dTMP kinase
MKAPRDRRGTLVFVEGIDGAGKSTLVRGLCRRLRALGYGAAVHREPTNPQLGSEAVRRGPDDPLGSALLFTLDRSLSRTRVERLRRRNQVVLQDRSYFSTMAYQGARLSPRVRRLLYEAQLASSARPGIVLWLRVPVPEAVLRVRRRGRASPLERQRIQVGAHAAYARLSRGKEWRVLDGRLPAAQLLERATLELRRHLGPPAKPGR